MAFTWPATARSRHPAAVPPPDRTSASTPRNSTCHRQGVALRLRKQGRQWLQTVKCAGSEAEAYRPGPVGVSLPRRRL
ncbi:MAG: hypothetical protein MZW92_38385 [Comamonadaceae bacterium]|nr:hypothetical protein [Comamonadaceae bacterium]